MKRSCSRRAILRGAGGAALGLPLLELTAGAQLQPPKRFLLVSVGHSVDVTRGVDSWLPRGDWAQLSPILAPLIPLRDKLLVISGIDNLLCSSGLVPTNGHNYSSRSLLTCMPTKESLDAAGNLLPARPECKPGSLAGGPSFEYVLASAWKDQVLNLRVGERPGEHVRSYRMDGTLDEGIPNPRLAFDRLFAGKPTGTATPEERLRGKRASILDAVRANFDRAVAGAGADDRMRLQRHADHVRQFELTLDSTTRIVCQSPQLVPPRPLPAAFEQGEGRFDDAIAAAQIELVTTAFACQAARVAHLHFSNIQVNTFPFLAGGQDFITGGWHGVVHLDRGTDEQRLRPMQWYMQVFGDLLNRLARTPEGAGNLLDNTLVLWISSLRQSSHGTTDLPVLLAGNLGGKLKTGRHLHFAPARTTGDLFTTLLNLLDVPAASFGWNRGATDKGRPWNGGPLPGLG